VPRAQIIQLLASAVADAFPANSGGAESRVDIAPSGRLPGGAIRV